MFGDLFSANLYRICKSKVPVILLIIAAVVTLYSGYILIRVELSQIISKEDFLEMAKESDDTLEGASKGYILGADAATNELDMNEIRWGEGYFIDVGVDELYCINTQLCTFVMINAILVCTYIGSELKTGFYRNLTNVIGKRHIPILSQYALFAAVCAVECIINLVFTLIDAFWFQGAPIWHISSQFFAYFFMSWIMLCAMTSVYIGLIYVIRTKTIPLIISICISLDVHTSILKSLTRIIEHINPNFKFKIVDYLVSTHLEDTLDIYSPANVFFKVLALSGIYIIISMSLSIYLNKKRDYK